MYDELKNLLKHGSIYTVGIVLSRIISFLMIPLYTNYLRPEEYGTLELLSLSIDIISTVMGFGMTASVLRFYFNKNDSAEKNKVISTAMLGTAIIMGVTSILCLIASNQLSDLIFHSSENAGLLRIMFLTMLMTSIGEVPLAYLRIIQKSTKFVLISLIRLILQLSLNILFLVVLKQGISGILYSGLITSVLMGIYLASMTSFETGIRFDRKLYWEMLAYGLPLIVSDISAFVLAFSDRFFLNYYTNLSDVGIYSLAYKFGMLLSMVFVAPFTQIWSARMFEIYHKENSKELISKVLTLFLFGALIINLAISVLTKDVLRLISNEAYWSAYKLVPVISLAYVFNGIVYIVGLGILATGKTKLSALAMILAMAVNIGFNFILIPHWGKAGAAYATLISYLFRVILIYVFSQSLFKIKYEWKALIFIGCISLGIIYLSHFIVVGNKFISLFLNSLLIVIFAVISYFSGVFTAKEKVVIRACIRNPMEIRKFINSGIG